MMWYKSLLIKVLNFLVLLSLFFCRGFVYNIELIIKIVIVGVNVYFGFEGIKSKIVFVLIKV